MEVFITPSRKHSGASRPREETNLQRGKHQGWEERKQCSHRSPVHHLPLESTALKGGCIFGAIKTFCPLGVKESLCLHPPRLQLASSWQRKLSEGSLRALSWSYGLLAWKITQCENHPLLKREKILIPGINSFLLGLKDFGKSDWMALDRLS